MTSLPGRGLKGRVTLDVERLSPRTPPVTVSTASSTLLSQSNRSFQTIEETADEELGRFAGQGSEYPKRNLSQETLIVSEEYYEN